MSWLLILIGVVAAPVFAFQLLNGIKHGKIRGTNFFVDRAENPLVFKMAIVLNALFVIMAICFIFEGLARLVK